MKGESRWRPKARAGSTVSIFFHKILRNSINYNFNLNLKTP
jgi:hypothetical protein